MIKDIQQFKVEHIAIAAVPQRHSDAEEAEWYIYLINLKDEAITNVLVSSRGYGHVNDEVLRTSELRHFLDEMPAKSFAKIEPIMEALFKLNNQYWVSFYQKDVLYDKKYVFLPETIQEAHLTDIPLMGQKGILLS